MTRDIGNSADVIDVRDLIERFEELEPAYGELPEDFDPDNAGDDFDHVEYNEFAAIKSFLEDLEGNGGDHDWRGEWYPVTLVRDSYFEQFARDEAESLDLIKDDAHWPYTCIDWEKAADELQVDYTTAEYGGVTYWYR